MRVAVLISGGGTTLKNLLAKKAAGELDLDVSVVISSTKHAKGLAIAEAAGIPTLVVSKATHPDDDAASQAIFSRIREAGADYVVLGGFLKLLKIPPDFVGRLVNIHPSLVPSFCGHGFYGHHVHEAALEYGVKISGCTVHFVDGEFDHGPIILQRTVPVLDGDTPDALATRVFEAECEAYPEALRLLAAGRVQLDGRRVRILPESAV